MRTTHRLFAIAVILTGMLSSMMASTFAQDIAGPGSGEIRVPGTETVIRVTPEEARLSRDGGMSWRPLAAPDTRLMLRYRVFDPLERTPVLPAVLRADSSNRVRSNWFWSRFGPLFRGKNPLKSRVPVRFESGLVLQFF